MDKRNPPQTITVYSVPLQFSVYPRKGGSNYTLALSYRNPERNARSNLDYGKIEFKRKYVIENDDPKTIHDKIMEIAPSFFKALDNRINIAHPLRHQNPSLELIWILNRDEIFAQNPTSKSTQKNLEVTGELVFALTQSTPWENCTPSEFQTLLADTYSTEQCKEINKFLRQLFNSQMALGYFADDSCKNPWADDLFHLPTHGYNEKTESKKRTAIHSYSDTQYQKIIAFCNDAITKKRNIKMIAIAILLLLLQVDVNEIPMLRRDELKILPNYNQKVLDVTHHLSDHKRLPYANGSPKQRTVPIPQILDSLLESLPENTEHPFILEHPRNRKSAISPQQLKSAINTCLEALVPISEPHDNPVTLLRNTGKSRGEMIGFQSDELNYLRGLVPKTMGAKHYKGLGSEGNQVVMAEILNRDMTPRSVTCMPMQEQWTPKKCNDTFVVPQPSTRVDVTIQIPPFEGEKDFVTTLVVEGGANICTQLKERNDSL